MFRKILTVAALASGLAGLVPSAEAMPLASGATSAPEITLVAGGCGPGYARGPYGGCRPFVGRPYYGAPRYAAPRFYEPTCFVRRDRFGRPVRVCR